MANWQENMWEGRGCTSMGNTSVGKVSYMTLNMLVW